MNERFETMQKICPKCGEAADVNARFCKYCAFDLANSDVHQNASTEINQLQSKNNTLPIILSGVGLLVIGLIGLMIFIGIGKNNQSVVENVNSLSQTSASTLSLGEKGQQIEEKILRGESLSVTDIEGLSLPELRILRNVHFARYGRKYDKGGLGDYFSTRAWYKPSDDYKDTSINGTDKENINLIVAMETALNNQAVSVTSPTVTPEMQASPTPAKGELTRDIVFSLLKGRNKQVIERLPRRWGEKELYERMMKDKVISCEKHYQIKGVTDYWNYINCTPVGNVSGLTVIDSEAIKIEVGSKVPSQVTGISKVDENTAYADVVFTFKEGAGYNFYMKYFDSSRKNFSDETHRFILRLYDDGWRVERSIS